jgi:hypothetical protein
MIWRITVRRAAPGEQFERVIVREFDDDVKAHWFALWQRFLAKFWGETIHVRGPQLVVTPQRP